MYTVRKAYHQEKIEVSKYASSLREIHRLSLAKTFQRELDWDDFLNTGCKLFDLNYAVAIRTDNNQQEIISHLSKKSDDSNDTSWIQHHLILTCLLRRLTRASKLLVQLVMKRRKPSSAVRLLMKKCVIIPCCRLVLLITRRCRYLPLVLRSILLQILWRLI